ncbi:MAG: hypothetical protein ACI4KM_08635 [Oscillospiraceae bacterium]
MLKSKFSKSNTLFKAQKLFTDRVEPSAVFTKSLQMISAKPQEILVYYGKGGIGKSSLLKKLYLLASDIYSQIAEYKVHPVFVSLDAYDFANPINILMAIRNGVVGDCGLFDYAMLQYCSKAKLNVEEIMQKNSVLSSPIMGVLNELISLGTMSACIPTATLQKCISLIKDHRMMTKYKSEIEEINTLNEFEIFERLPYYLGICISNAAEKGNFHVLFLDSYESLLARTEYGTFSVDCEDWLRELFLSSEAIRFVIASRDRLRWDHVDSEWADFMQQHLLNNLSDEDSRWFLQQVPIRDEAVIDSIVENAGGVPLYLDMCVSIYEDDINSGKPFEMTSVRNGEKIISRYIRHLSAKDKLAISILAALKSFDYKFADSLLKRNQVIYETDELKELMEKSIFLSIDSARGLWKVDESVRLHQRARVGHEKAAEILGNILACLMEASEGQYYQHLSLVIETACDWPDVLDSIEERCIEAIEYYANVGFWGELHTLLSGCVDNENERLRTLATVEELIYLRRTGRLKEAEQLADTHPLSKEILGNWYYMYRFICTQIKHLLGNYDESLNSYRALIEEMDLIRPLIPNHIYIAPCMKYADILFLKGRFDESLERVQKLEAENALNPGDRIELLRIKGHIYRFQKEYKSAELIYRCALKLAEDHGLRAYCGKLYTNMAEALCVVSPEEALEWFNKAREENLSTENDIELGKALAAASAAYTTLGSLDEGVMFAKQAVSTAEKTGYLSGQAFGLAVLYYALKQSDRIEEAEHAKASLCQIIERIGVYRYLSERVAE